MRCDYPRLMGLRFVLALCVLGYHMLPLTAGLLPIPLPLYWLLDHAWLAVDGFFILSGFIIPHHYGHTLQTFHGKTYGHFLWLRLARVYPLHIVTLLALAVMVWVAGLRGMTISAVNYSLSDFIQNILLIQAWHLPDHLDWNHPAWAISIEWLLYLLSPILFRLLLRPRPRWQAAMLFKFSLFLMPLAMVTLPYDTHIAYSVIRGICGFMAGIFLYQCLFDRPLIVPHTQWLASPAMQVWGQTSYAIYMLQYPILLVASHASLRPGLSALPVALKGVYLIAIIVVILGTARLAHRFIEEPARRALRMRNPF